MDRSVLRVLEALLPGPALPGILATSYGMEVAEAEGALGAAVAEGWVEGVGPVGFGLTVEGREVARELVGGGRLDRAESIELGLTRRAARVR